jgi:hypothetical protein
MNTQEYFDIINKETRLDYIKWLSITNPKIVKQNLEKVNEELRRYEQYKDNNSFFDSRLVGLVKMITGQFAFEEKNKLEGGQ